MNVLQVEALCWCGKRATHNARTENGVMVTEGEVIVVGDVECRSTSPRSGSPTRCSAASTTAGAHRRARQGRLAGPGAAALRLTYVDTGGGSAPSEPGHQMGGMAGMSHGGRAVADLVEDPARPADVRFTLTVTATGDRILVNGTSPGPVLRVTQGQLVEVTLVNASVRDGTPALARGRRAERRGRRRRRHPGRGRGGRPARLPLRRRSTPAPTGTTRTRSPTSRCAAGCSARSSSRRSIPSGDAPGTTWSRSCTSTTASRRSTGGGHLACPPCRTGTRCASAWSTPTTAPGLGLGHRRSVPGARRRRHGPERADRGDRPGGPASPPAAGSTSDRGPRREAPGSTSTAPRRPAGPRPRLGAVPAQPKHQLDLLTYGTRPPRASTRARPDRTVRLLDRAPARLPRRHARACGGRSTGTCSRRADVRRRGGRRRADAHREPQRRRPPDAPARPPRGGAVPRRRKPRPAARGGSTRSTSADGHEYEIAFVADNPGIWMDHCHNLPHARRASSRT
jgi:hypothetical protein